MFENEIELDFLEGIFEKLFFPLTTYVAFSLILSQSKVTSSD